MNKIWGVSALVALMLGGCAQMTREEQGGLAGGLVGGIVGNQIGGGTGRVLATATGAVVGSMMGASVGRQLDALDQSQLNRALETQPTAQRYEWVNPDTHLRYRLVPKKTYYEQEQPCRLFALTTLVDGKTNTVVKKACRRNNGVWEVVG